jgi:myo-inositol 2-dehydrogenase/D-chiro-inositol 1-dehydrogenase
MSRRTFIKHTTLGLAGAATLNVPLVAFSVAGDAIEIKIGVIGCGGRGTGATLDALGAATTETMPPT